MKTYVIAGFPGVGKSFCTRSFDNMLIKDSDSSKFPKDKFPENYIEDTKSNLGKYDVIFVSTHEEVLDALEKEGIKYILVFPTLKLRKIYISRYSMRGSPKEFIQKISDNWNSWILSLIESRRSQEKKFIFIRPSQNLYEMLSDILIRYEYWYN